MERGYEDIKIDTEENDAKQRTDFPEKKSKLKKKYIIIAVIVLLAVVIAAVIFGGKRKVSTELMNTELAAVTRRDIQNIVTGSSVLEPKDSYSVTARVTGEILSDTFSEGDVVKKGDVLYKIDAESAQKSVTSAENSFKKAQRNYNDLLEDSGNLAVKAYTSGKISEVLVKKGDDVNAGTKIANIYSDTYMEISLPFNENDVSAIFAGSPATVTVVGTGEEIWGSVTHISTASSSLASHAIVRYVTIEVKNPGALTVKDSGTAIVNGVACADAAKFEYTGEGTIVAEISGEISQLYIKKQDKVTSGQVVARITSDDIENRITDAKTDMEEAQMKLDDAKDNLDDYTITAPIDGTIVAKNKKAGDNLINGTAVGESNSMADIYDLSSLKFQLSVDETEVEKIKVGQSVSVTADAVEGEFEGIVTKVGIDGMSSNGVTTYPVDVEIKEYGKLLPGMNITAEIVTEQVKSALAVPVSAVRRGNVVYVKDADAEGKKNNSAKKTTPENETKQKEDGDMSRNTYEKVPEGYKAVQVELGINDLEYIQVVSGLTEGDEVLVESVAKSESSQFPMMPGMGGMSDGMNSATPGGMNGTTPGGMR